MKQNVKPIKQQKEKQNHNQPITDKALYFIVVYLIVLQCFLPKYTFPIEMFPHLKKPNQSCSLAWKFISKKSSPKIQLLNPAQ